MIEAETEFPGIRNSGEISELVRRSSAPLFEAGDIFVLPSLDNALGIVVLEAIAAGLPVVGGLPESWMKPDVVAGAVPPAQLQALAERLRLLILDSGLCCAMGAAGSDRIREHFSA